MWARRSPATRPTVAAATAVSRPDGEIDELYLAPEYQGLGFGRRMFKAVRNDLEDRGSKRIAIWCLTENERGCSFYRGMGGRLIAETTERFSGVAVAKSCYLFR
jgi:GNAT superfamily N-acetyltransferase